MLSPRWHKVLRDLWGNKARTILVVLSIAVGVFAVGMISASRAILAREMDAAWAGVRPASVTLYTDYFREELLYPLRKMPGVEDADARNSFSVRFAAADPAMDEDTRAWRSLVLYTVPDFEDIRVQQIRSQSGAWPPPRNELLIERASLDWMGAEIGDTILVESPNGKVREMRIAGTAHDMTEMQASWNGRASGYVSPQTLGWLGMGRYFDILNVIAADTAADREAINLLAAEVRDKVERAGYTVHYTFIPTPGKHPAAETIDPIMAVLGVLGFLSLFLSGFLVFNTLQALLAQQVRQIGVMKALGARGGQVMGLYYGMVLAFALLSLAIAVPLGAVGANGMIRFVTNLINFDIGDYRLPIQVLALQLCVGLGVPLVAALLPILSAVRITPREAMSDYGLSNGHQGTNLLDRVLERIRGVSRPLLLSLRNTFRRRARLLLTLATLTLGGAIFIAVFSVRDSVLLTLDDMFDYVQYDVYVNFNHLYRIDQIEREALRVPGVTAAEAWIFSTARRVRPDETESENIQIRAPRAESDLVHPTLVEGRWLLPDDENAIVLNTMLLKDEPDIRAGDEITLKIDGRETDWVVVGIMSGTPPAPMGYANYAYLARMVGYVGRAGVAFIQTEAHDGASQAAMAKALEGHFERLGLQVHSTMTATTERTQIESRFDALIIFLLIMALILALVGAIGLMGTMSLNVLERTREIGVMRAIGAADGAILQIVIVEGVLIGLLSWLVGALLALPLGQLLSQIVGDATMRCNLSYMYSIAGTGLWLIVVIVLAALASLWPARNASRVSVREVLAYE